MKQFSTTPSQWHSGSWRWLVGDENERGQGCYTAFRASTRGRTVKRSHSCILKNKVVYTHSRPVRSAFDWRAVHLFTVQVWKYLSKDSSRDRAYCYSQRGFTPRSCIWWIKIPVQPLALHKFYSLYLLVVTSQRAAPLRQAQSYWGFITSSRKSPSPA